MDSLSDRVLRQIIHRCNTVERLNKTLNLKSREVRTYVSVKSMGPFIGCYRSLKSVVIREVASYYIHEPVSIPQEWVQALQS